jgi:hypothetical protein
VSERDAGRPMHSGSAKGARTGVKGRRLGAQ